MRISEENITSDHEMLEKVTAQRGTVKQITCYAICDNDGGRLITPVPLARHIYTTEAEAKQVAKTRHFQEAYYPVRKVVIHA